MQYVFRHMTLGDVDNVVNNMAAEGYSPRNLYKEGPRLYILFGKWEDEEEVELSELDQVYEDLSDVSARLFDVESALKALLPVPVGSDREANVPEEDSAE